MFYLPWKSIKMSKIGQRWEERYKRERWECRGQRHYPQLAGSGMLRGEGLWRSEVWVGELGGRHRHGGAIGNDIGSFREGVLVLQGPWVISEGGELDSASEELEFYSRGLDSSPQIRSQNYTLVIRDPLLSFVLRGLTLQTVRQKIV